jgi:hypothetical protein
MPKFISEGAIFQEAKIIKSDPKKAIFRMTMQEAEEVNQNKRRYPKQVLEGGMSNCKDRMQRRAFLGEMDHPVPTGQDTFDGIRQTTVALRDVSHLIRGYEFQGNRLVGELETLDTPNGKILLSLLKDKSGVGLSMRGMAELDRQAGINIVKAPLYIITFDAVSMPSHKGAVVDFNEMKFESINVLTESCNGVICTPDGKCFLPDFFEKLIENKIITFFDRWI